MSVFKNPMEILGLLEKTNCRECNETTCLAFAAAVFKGNKKLAECPNLGQNVLERFAEPADQPVGVEQSREQVTADLKKTIGTLDLRASAERVGGTYEDGRLTLRILGKNFTIDAAGHLSSDIHIHPWVTIPILSYVIESMGMPVAGIWVPFRELKNGRVWQGLFEQRGEKPLKKVADIYTALFEDMIHIFNGKQVQNHYTADISLVLYPLPKVPLLICYWKPEDGMESSLSLFFDQTAEQNLRIESIYTLTTGLVRMFERIALRHG